jgi:hypothetical protein
MSAWADMREAVEASPSRNISPTRASGSSLDCALTRTVRRWLPLTGCTTAVK